MLNDALLQASVLGTTHIARLTHNIIVLPYLPVTADRWSCPGEAAVTTLVAAATMAAVVAAVTMAGVETGSGEHTHAHINRWLHLMYVTHTHTHYARTHTSFMSPQACTHTCRGAAAHMRGCWLPWTFKLQCVRLPCLGFQVLCVGVRTLCCCLLNCTAVAGMTAGATPAPTTPRTVWWCPTCLPLPRGRT